jgi:hypothetical protein
MLDRCQAEGRTHSLGVPEPSRNVDGGDKGQGNHRSDTGHSHEAPTDVVIPRNQKQLAMQARKVFPQNLASIQKRLHNLGQIRHTLDKLMDPPVEPDRADHANLEAKVAQQAADVALNSEGLSLEHLASG